jgi:O-antigen/teichoic acid export membrane protein
VSGALSGLTINTILFRLLSLENIGYKFSLSEIKSYFSYGMAISSQRIVWYLNGQVDVLMVGKLLGVIELGVLSIAKEFAHMVTGKVMPIISTVLFPAMSKELDRNKLLSTFFKANSNLYTLLMPACWGIAATSDLLVQLLLGEKWSNSSPVIFIMALAIPMTLVSSLYVTMFNAIGKPRFSLENTIFDLINSIISIYIGVHWGLLGVAWAIAISIMLSFFFKSFRFCYLLEINIFQILKTIMPSLLASFAMLAVVKIIEWSGFFTSWILLAVCIVFGALTYIIVRYILDPNSFVDLFDSLINKKV